jgi:hypothetical protein
MIGGCDDVKTLQASGQLETMLSGVIWKQQMPEMNMSEDTVKLPLIEQRKCCHASLLVPTNSQSCCCLASSPDKTKKSCHLLRELCHHSSQNQWFHRENFNQTSWLSMTNLNQTS